MWKIIQITGIFGFFICLLIMYMTNIGARGIRQYDPTFQSPDMKFHYSVEQITYTFEQIGEGGRAIFQKYLLLDCVFTLCFIVVMIVITNLLFTGTIICNLMYVVCILRALFDLLENVFLYLVLRQFPVVDTLMVTLCSYLTTIKFIMLYIWVFVLIAHFVLKFFTR